MEEKKDNFRLILRVAGVDFDGNKKVIDELRKVKGVSFAFANMLCKTTGINRNLKAGYLDEKNSAKIEEVIRNPSKFNVPDWLLNRRADPEDGSNKHLFGSDLTFANQNEIRQMQKVKSYRGIRHYLRLPMRGQRTKSNFRRNKGKVTGVARSKSKGKKR